MSSILPSQRDIIDTACPLTDYEQQPLKMQMESRLLYKLIYKKVGALPIWKIKSNVSRV